MATWGELIADAMRESGETDAKIVSNTLTKEELVIEFDNGYGLQNGIPFTMWTEQRVYFPVCYDGAEWVGSVPRHPCGEKTGHHGGG